jgi:flagellar hook assembly protein FlgD
MEGVGIDDLNKETISLRQNMPNPCSKETTIQFNLPSRDYVSLKIYDLNGKEVMNVLDGQTPAGDHQIRIDTQNLRSGIYYYTLKTTTGKETRKMVVVK